jgi:hypothetical protein
MFRRMFVGGGMLVLGAVALVLIPGSESRAGDHQDKQSFNKDLTQDGDVKYAVLNEDWFVGNCVLMKGARVEFQKGGKCHFTGSAYTTFSLSGDVFHLHFTAHGTRNVQAVVEKQFRLPEAGGGLPIGNGGTKFVTVDETRDYDNSTFEALQNVDWMGGC